MNHSRGFLPSFSFTQAKLADPFPLPLSACMECQEAKVVMGSKVLSMHACELAVSECMDILYILYILQCKRDG